MGVTEMTKNRQYDMEYKVQALKLAHEIGGQRAAEELGIPKNTLYGWMHKERQGAIDLGPGSRSPDHALTLSQELTALRQQVREQEKEIRRLKELNEFLEDASAFFAASCQKSAKNKG